MKRIVAILLLLPLIGCYKNNPRPNEPFFCKINGKAFRPETDTGPIGGGGGLPLSATLDRDYHWLYLDAIRTPELITIYIKLDSTNVIRNGKTLLGLNDNLGSIGGYYLNYIVSNREKIYSSSGFVTISKISNGTISGTFEFTCKSSKTGKEYKITKGCFNDLFYL